MFAAYRKYGIRTIPLLGKVPPKGVSWKAVTLNDRFEESYPDANVGVICGDVISIIDVDDPSLIGYALEKFGDTPLLTETPRGGRHLWYRANGEGTAVGVDGLKIDVRGVGGYAVAPQSKGYRFVRGDVEEIPNLPSINPGALPPKTALSPLREGDGRNNALFAEGRKIGKEVESEEALLGRLLALNQDFAEPLPFNEVATIVKSVWKYREEGRLITSERPATVVFHDEYDRLADDSDARVLLFDLRRNHGARQGQEFALADCTRERFGKKPKSWTIGRFKAAVQTLVEMGFLEVTHKGGRVKGDVRRARLL